MIHLVAFLDRNAGRIILAALVLALAIWLVACGDAPPPRPPAPPPAPAVPTPATPADAPPATAPAADRLAYWENRAIVLEGATVAAKAEAKALRQEASLAPFRALMVWATWAGGIVALGGVIVAALAVPMGLPIGWKAALLISGCGVALAAGAQGLATIAPWLPGIGLAMLILAIVGLLAWELLAHRDGLRRLWEKTQDEAAADPRLATLLRKARVIP
jgi:hypothetical protein